MRLGSVLSEAMRNIAAGTSRAFLLFLAVLLSGGLLGGYEAMTVMALEQEAATRIHADADVKSYTYIYVDGVTCDRLTEVEAGPSASGAMRAGPQIVPKSTLGRDIASYEVTPGMLALVIAGEDDPTLAADAGGVWVSNVMANDFGLTVGSRFETEQGTSTVSGVFDWRTTGVIRASPTRCSPRSPPMTDARSRSAGPNSGRSATRPMDCCTPPSSSPSKARNPPAWE